MRIMSYERVVLGQDEEADGYIEESDWIDGQDLPVLRKVFREKSKRSCSITHTRIHSMIIELQGKNLPWLTCNESHGNILKSGFNYTDHHGNII